MLRFSIWVSVGDGHHTGVFAPWGKNIPALEAYNAIERGVMDGNGSDSSHRQCRHERVRPGPCVSLDDPLTLPLLRLVLARDDERVASVLLVTQDPQMKQTAGIQQTPYGEPNKTGTAGPNQQKSIPTAAVRAVEPEQARDVYREKYDEECLDKRRVRR